MMEKLEKIALTKLLKLELPQFVKQVTACLEKHNPESLKLQDTYELLNDQCDKMKLLVAPYGPHPLTEQIQQLHQKRLRFAAAITMQMNMFRKLDFEESREWVRIAHPVVRIHLNYLRKNNQPVIDRILDIFFKQLKDNPEEQHALEMLGLKYCLDELRSANDEYDKLTTIRLRQISQRPKAVSGDIQKEAQYILRSFFEQINFYQFTYKDVNYTPLISELNNIIVRFRGLINTRATCGATRKEKAKIKAAEVDTQIEETTPKESSLKTKSKKIAKDRTTKGKEAKSNYTPINKADVKETDKDLPLQNLIRILKFPNKRGSS
ncbi:MAG: DUF6261 family protein [Dysgonamonadaceae bacterium]|nr:DUF6261 family protein [Dysgonamonadaceae bacterium]MDD4729931.1 DUF6261 family protein [Dysgonamonadaceae bacterium]